MIWKNDDALVNAFETYKKKKILPRVREFCPEFINSFSLACLFQASAIVFFSKKKKKKKLLLFVVRFKGRWECTDPCNRTCTLNLFKVSTLVYFLHHYRSSLTKI